MRACSVRKASVFKSGKYNSNIYEENISVLKKYPDTCGHGLGLLRSRFLGCHATRRSHPKTSAAEDRLSHKLLQNSSKVALKFFKSSSKVAHISKKLLKSCFFLKTS